MNPAKSQKDRKQVCIVVDAGASLSVLSQQELEIWEQSQQFKKGLLTFIIEQHFRIVIGRINIVQDRTS